MHAWLGREKLAEKIGDSQGPLYIIIEEAGQEAVVLREILEDLAVGSVSRGEDWYYVPDWKDPSCKVGVSRPQGRGTEWLQAVNALPETLLQQYWAQKETGRQPEEIVADLAAETMEELNANWPETVEYHTGLVEHILEHVEDPEYLDLNLWLPGLLWKGGERPVIRAEGVSRGVMAGREERRREGRWIPGLLQRAAGGYLLIEAVDLLGSSGWPVLRDALLGGKIEEPCEAPLTAQVVLFGSGGLYRALCEWDPDFRMIFAQTVFMLATVEDDETHRQEWLRAIGEMVQFPVEAAAGERLLQYLWRQEAAGRIPCCIGKAEPWLYAAERFCWETDLSEITGVVMERILAEEREEISQSLRKYWAREGDSLAHVVLQGKRVGCVHGLAVVDLGYMTAGEPLVITATYAPPLVIESVEERHGLGGRVFSKSWETLRGYLGRLGRPNSKIVVNFEKNYHSIEGDSALLAQAYCILSLLSEYPIQQNIGITGTLDSQGRVLAVGSIHEKIEGFFDFCQWRGEKGGVIFPAENADGLYLAADVQQAIEKGEFVLYPIKALEEGIPLLMGVSAGRVMQRAIRRMK